ncbi:MAG: hypothetical protein BAJALOKI1v1_1340009 [Promethearchaeota archaeon]|nr:MAG: hypothetical protein BAJALOKI1v1_1340009 [Candidatus Lokiarchaeota archaeon]
MKKSNGSIDKSEFKEVYLNICDFGSRIYFAADKVADRLKTPLLEFEELIKQLRDSTAKYIYNNDYEPSKIYHFYIKVKNIVQHDNYISHIPIRPYMDRILRQIDALLKKYHANIPGAFEEDLSKRAGQVFLQFLAEQSSAAKQELKDVIYIMAAMIKSVDLAQNLLHSFIMELIDLIGKGVYGPQRTESASNLTLSEVTEFEKHYHENVKTLTEGVNINSDNFSTLLQIIEHAFNRVKFYSSQKADKNFL